MKGVTEFQTKWKRDVQDDKKWNQWRRRIKLFGKELKRPEGGKFGWRQMYILSSSSELNALPP